MSSPHAYARQIAYISCPTTIRQRVLEEFTRAPSIETIRRYQADRKRKDALTEYRGFCRDSERDDALHFKPRGLARVRKVIKPKPCPEPKVPTPPMDWSHRPFPKFGLDLVAAVSADLGLSPDDVAGPTRLKLYVHARAIISKILHDRNSTVWSYPEIGRLLGGRDHTSILHCVKNLPKYMGSNPKLAEVYKARGGQ